MAAPRPRATYTMASRRAKAATKPRDAIALSKGAAAAVAGLLFSVPITSLLLVYVEQREALAVFMVLLAGLFAALVIAVGWLALLDRKVTRCEGTTITLFEFLKILLLFSAVQLVLAVATDLIVAYAVQLPALLLIVNVVLAAALAFWPHLLAVVSGGSGNDDDADADADGHADAEADA